MEHITLPTEAPYRVCIGTTKTQPELTDEQRMDLGKAYINHIREMQAVSAYERAMKGV